VGTEAQARAVFFAADSSGLGVSTLKAQLLAAKLNGLKFPGFIGASFPSGLTVGEVVADADALLNDLANDISRSKAEVNALSDLLDAANNSDDVPVLQTGQPPECAIPTAAPHPGQHKPPRPSPPRPHPGGPRPLLQGTGGDSPTSGPPWALPIVAIAVVGATAASLRFAPRRRGQGESIRGPYMDDDGDIDGDN